MSERFDRALSDYREKTRRTAPPAFTENVLDRLGLADRYDIVDSPLGPVYVAWNARGIAAVRQATSDEEFERWFRLRFKRRAFRATDEPEKLDAVRRALAGEAVDAAELEIDLRDCTPFEAAVLRKAREIPRGHARPYAWVAREIGAARAVRAVGSALANNPIPLIIPCHRVVRSDFSTGEYVFGSEAKRTLIAGEGLHIDVAARLAREGVRFIGNVEGGWFCLPTCGNVWDQIPPAARLQFHTTEEAQACGLRACKTCKPIPIAA